MLFHVQGLVTGMCAVLHRLRLFTITASIVGALNSCPFLCSTFRQLTFSMAVPHLCHSSGSLVGRSFPCSGSLCVFSFLCHQNLHCKLASQNLKCWLDQLLRDHFSAPGFIGQSFSVQRAWRQELRLPRYKVHSSQLHLLSLTVSMKTESSAPVQDGVFLWSGEMNDIPQRILVTFE